jgi:hypothetical protein
MSWSSKKPCIEGHLQITDDINPVDWLPKSWTSRGFGICLSASAKRIAVLFETLMAIIHSLNHRSRSLRYASRYLTIWQAEQCLCAGNASPFMRHDCLPSCSVGRWVKHVTSLWWVITCVMQVSSQHSHVKGPFVSCSAVLVARAGVKCTACVGARERAIWLRWEVPTQQ